MKAGRMAGRCASGEPACFARRRAPGSANTHFFLPSLSPFPEMRRIRPAEGGLIVSGRYTFLIFPSTESLDESFFALLRGDSAADSVFSSLGRQEMNKPPLWPWRQGQ